VKNRSYCFTDELLRITTAKLKVELGPARWRSTSQVHLDAGGFDVSVRLVDVPAATTHGGRRRFMVCPSPSCGQYCTTLAVVPGVGWLCRRCAGWRGRPRRNAPYHSGSSARPRRALRSVGQDLR
jgi:hypothetical protein